jgi:hypothetical protein
MMPRLVTVLALIRVRSATLINYRLSATENTVSAGYGYQVQLLSATNTITIGPGATRGLVVHPVGTSLFIPRPDIPTLMHSQPRGWPSSPSYFLAPHISPWPFLHRFYLSLRLSSPLSLLRSTSPYTSSCTTGFVTSMVYRFVPSPLQVRVYLRLPSVWLTRGF